jgi:catechol 2,3-dioxygenase-like lactoylglutathione lyase family enzyme
MAVLRPHLALTVSDVDRSIPFYRALLGIDPAKVRHDYAKFEVEEPALNLTLNAGEPGASLGALNHAGIQVSSTDEVLAARDRLTAGGLATFDERDTTCCYARQDKVWVHDPDGTPWEVFATLEDSEAEGDRGPAPAMAANCGCGEEADGGSVCCSEVTACCAV